jgi:hypothetical protein
MPSLKSALLIAATVATLAATGCAPIRVATPSTTAAPQVVAAPVVVPATPGATVPTVAPGPTDATAPSAVTISLGQAMAVDGAGVAVSGSTVTITAGGTYRLTGTLADGQVIVAAPKDASVQVILDGAGITSSTSAPIYVKSAKSVAITLADGSTNYLADGASRPGATSAADEPNATLYSVVDLTIGGDGSLVVDGHYDDGIASKDDLAITGGSIAVTAVGDGIRGRDRLDVAGGTIVVDAGKDGLTSSNDEDPEKGIVAISGGTIQVTARGDGIQAETDVAITGGTIAIAAGGGSTASPSADLSSKGIKGTVDVTIDGGAITVDAADDALHSNGSLAIRGGTLLLASADDGLHADKTLDIAGGDVTISTSYEGIESARITISDGRVRIKSRDDGLNAAGGTGESAVPGWPGQSSPGVASDYHLTMSGGYLVIDSETDGIDVNGSIEMTGGVAIVHGPTAQHDGAIDYDRTFTIGGGTLIAAGSAGMAQAPSTSSTQPSVQVTFPASQPAGTMVHVGTPGGEEVLTFVPSKAYQSLVVSSPELQQGATYLVHTGGSSTGAATDGLYSDGAYTAGTQAASFTVAGAVTSAGSGNVGVGRGGGPRR